jgi:hypothetical protein
MRNFSIKASATLSFSSVCLSVLASSSGLSSGGLCSFADEIMGLAGKLGVVGVVGVLSSGVSLPYFNINLMMPTG